MDMKGIALSVIAFLVIALVSIMVLIIFVGNQLSPSLKKGYCDIIFGLRGILPIPENLRPTPPSYCIVDQSGTREVDIESSEPDKISYDIAGYVVSCWKMTGEIGSKLDKICFELRLKRLDGTLTEDLVKQELEKVDYASILDWKAGTITSPTTLAIYFNASNNLIGVI